VEVVTCEPVSKLEKWQNREFLAFCSPKQGAFRVGGPARQNFVNVYGSLDD
jgi:hypothetical protein